MLLLSWLQNRRCALAHGPGKRHGKRRGPLRTARAQLEALEDRIALSFGWDGTYSQQPPAGVTFAATAPLLADVTSDGIPDRVELIPYQVVVRPGLGNGTFGDTIRSGGQYAHTLALGDFNGDTRLDAFTLNYPAPRLPDGDYECWGSVLLGRGDGTFSYAGDIGFGRGMNAALYIGFGDIFGTGRTDVVVGGEQSEYDYIYLVLRNNGDWGALPPPPPPSLSINDLYSGSAIKEGNTGVVSATFTVTLSRASTEPITVDYATSDDTAIAGIDYQATSGTLTFAPGQTSKTITFRVIGDRLAEFDEYFAVNLTDAHGASIFDGQGFATIVDNEPRISISDRTKSEGKRGKTTLVTFTVTLSATYDQPVTMSFRTVDGTAKTSDGDYIARTGTLTFAPGQTSKTITIEVKGDSKREASETFYLDLFGLSTNALFAKNRGLGTILNDD